MNKLSRRLFLGGAAATATVAFSGLAKSGQVRAQSQQLNLYSSRHYNTDSALYENFTSQTGIKVNLIEGDGDELIERIKSEGASGPADILLTVDAGRLWRADQEGLFQPVISDILTEKIPSYLRHPENHWFGFSKRARVIMYNKQKVNPSQLSTYEALIEPQWQGKIVIRSSTNIYNQSLVASLIIADGEAATEAWCKGMVANMARPPQGNDTAQIEAVAAGIADLAIANSYYLANLGESSEPQKKAIFDAVGVFFPNQNNRGTHINISGGGLIKTAPNREAGIKFLEYLVTPEAQNFFAQGNNEYPVLEGIELTPILASFGEFKADTASVANYGPNLATAVMVMDRAGWK